MASEREDLGDLGHTSRENRQSRLAIGPVLADALLPAISAEGMSSELAEGCLRYVETREVPSAALALPELLRIIPSLQDRAIKAIVQTMFSMDSEDMGSLQFNIQMDHDV